MRVVYWGTFDTGKPRNRLMIAALRSVGVEVIDCHVEVWGGIADKSRMGWLQRVGRLLHWLAAYPGLIRRYRRLPPHDAVMVGYLGHLDVLMLAPFARHRGVPVVWDVFLSLYDTVVRDRRLLGPRHPLARLLWWWERAACRAADCLVMDTAAHAGLLRDLYGLPANRLDHVFVGAEPDHFPRLPPPERPADAPLSVLFYGQFIPLHGIETIVRAAALDDSGPPVRWRIIGCGQEEGRIRLLLDGLPAVAVRWDRWVPYADLIDALRQADICLGIFGTSEKAARVIPNKAFQILSAGRPLVTRDSAAIRELVPPGTPGVRLVPPDDPSALLAAVRDLAASGECPSLELRQSFAPERLGHRLAAILRRAVAERQPRR